MVDKVDQDNPSETLNTNTHGKEQLTEANKQKILDIIDHQFDLEIYLKHREVATIRKEIENAEATLQDLELAIKNESLAATLPELPHFTRQSAAALYYGHITPSSSSSTPLSSSSGTGMARKKVSKPTSNQKSVLYGRRIDGVYVRLACPVCHRDNFSTQLGLLNHCRISHSLEFGFYENIMAQCGTPVDESEVPLDHPIRNRPLTLPVVPVATPKKLERPTIKEYEEDVDLELDQDGSTTKRKKAEPAPAQTPAQTPAQAPARELPDQNQNTSISSPIETDITMKNHDAIINTTTTTTTTSGTSPTNIHDSSSTAHSTPISIPTSASSPMMTTTLDSNQSTTLNTTLNDNLIPLAKESSSSTTANAINEQPALSSSSSTPPLPPPPPPLPSFNDTSTIAIKPPTSTQQQQQQPEKETSTSAPLTPVSEIPEENKTESLTSAIVEKGSRFYIKRRIVVGNVSKFIAPEKRDPTLKNYTHKWMIYVVEPPQDQDKAPFLTGVRYHLHPSYKPYDVVDVTESPFRLTRLGWGEFPIRLQLYFVDKRRNKSLDVIHHLKLDYTLSGRQMLGNERGFDIELDRNTNFQDLTTMPTPMDTPEIPSSSPPPLSPSQQQQQQEQQQQQQQLQEQQPSSTTTTILPPSIQSANMKSTVSDASSPLQQSSPFNTSKQRLILLQGILKESVQQYPIVIRAGSQLHQSGPIPSLPYTCARNSQHFLTLPSAKRKALEWHRAHLLRLLVQQRCQETNDTILRMAGDGLGTKEVSQWCRTQGYTPTASSSSDSTSNSPTTSPAPNYLHHPPSSQQQQYQEEQRDWCRYCGSETHTTVECKHKPKGWRKRMVLGEQHTLSNVQTLLTSLGLDLQQALQNKQQHQPLASNAAHDTTKTVAIDDDDDDDDVDVEVDLQHSPPSSYMTNNIHLSAPVSSTETTTFLTAATSLSSPSTFITTTTMSEPHQELLRLIRQVSLAGTMDDHPLDWIWSVIAQLRLKRMIGHDLTLARNGQLQFQRPVEPEVNQDTAMEQRLVVGQLFVQLTKIFLKKILKGGVATWQKERDQNGGPNDDNNGKLLVPYHIHQAVRQMDSMDFLTNAYMGTFKHDSQDTSPSHLLHAKSPLD